MTTIVYNHEDKEIAYDSRLIRGGMIATDDDEKAITNESGVFLMAGKTADVELVAKCYPEAPTREVDCYGFLIANGSVLWVADGGAEGALIQDYNEAAGSGECHAISAMDMGATAKEAVEMAARRDIYTGGKIRVIKVK